MDHNMPADNITGFAGSAAHSESGGFFSVEAYAHLFRLILGWVYAVLSTAFFGNLAIAYLVARILATGGGNGSNRSTTSSANRHMLIYVFALSVVDSLVLVNAAVVSTTILLRRWIFGRAMCTLYYTIDSVNKTLSTFILTCMSLDRYLAVRYPQRFFQLRAVQSTVAILGVCLLFAFLLLLPVYLQTDIIDAPVGDNETTPTCAFVGEPDFVIVTSLLGFVVPLVLMTGFYGAMISSLRTRRQRMASLLLEDYGSIDADGQVPARRCAQPRVSARVRKVTVRTLTLVLFHFVCWTPYWMTTFYIMFLDTEMRDSTVVLMYIVHVGTYLNSAVNPVLYGMFNKDLRVRSGQSTRRYRQKLVLAQALNRKGRQRLISHTNGICADV